MTPHKTRAHDLGTVSLLNATSTSLEAWLTSRSHMPQWGRRGRGR